MTVPEGRLGGSLTVVDESGRELGTVDHWSNGSTTIMARRSGGVGMSCYLNGNGSAIFQLTGTGWATRIEAQPDSMARTAMLDPSLRVDPSAIRNARNTMVREPAKTDGLPSQDGRP